MTACSTHSPAQTGAKPVDHSLYTELLQQHVNEKGFVNYQGLKAERSKLKAYLDRLVSSPPDEETWSKNEQLAYWINLYNAYTLELILRHYPVKSIKDIGSTIQIPFVNTPWDIKLIEIAGEEYDLNNIEHGIIRKNFNDPRIHFAVNCASISCPALRSEAYTGEKLDQQLDEQTRSFLADPTKSRISKDKLKLSKLFSWYGSDFDDKIAFIDKYTDIQLSEDPEVEYLDYDWGLNEAQ